MNIKLYRRFYINRLLHPGEFKRTQKMRWIETNKDYSLKPYDDNNCIFVHIPRCAGVSLSKTLFGNLGGGHYTIDDYSMIFNPNEFKTYFKFSIVRNPWDRLVSAYLYLKGGGIGDPDRIWFENNIAQYPDFHTFVKEWLNENNIWKWYHFKPQYSFICIDNTIAVDFLGRYESLQQDFNNIARTLNIKTVLIRENKTERNNYRDYYDDETKELVASVYDKDIKLFEYFF